MASRSVSHFCIANGRVSLGMPSHVLSPKNCPFASGNLYPHLIHGSLIPPDPTTQTASRLVQLFLQGSLLRQTNRPTNHATWSVRTGYKRSTAMRSNNNPSFRTIQVSWYQKNIHSLTLHLHRYYPILINFNIDFLHSDSLFLQPTVSPGFFVYL